MDKSLIQIFRGDDTDGLGYQSIQGKITTTLDLTGCRAVFRYLGFTQEFDPIPENGRITITMPASATSKFPPGLGYASLRVYDSENKVRTFTNRIPVFVTVYAPSECGGEFEVVFNGGNLELEPLKIKSVNGYRIYDGYLEQIIDKATAIEYGLALLFDSGDAQKDANSGYAATPKAVQAAYDAIIQELTDNYYNAEETDEAIDRIAAYYITSDAQGNPFATYAALAGATAFYSGGRLRTPTRNDYCVVLADETHGGEQYRYIYSVNQQGAGQWEAQYAVGGSVELDNTVTRTSTNGVKSSGIWSAIWGALTALPGFSSLYDWCVAQLAGKASTADATLTPIYSDTPTFSVWTFSDVSDGITNIQQPVFIPSGDEPRWKVVFSYNDITLSTYAYGSTEDAMNLAFSYTDEGFNLHLTATRERTDIIGYTLGSQSDKPLQPKGDYAPATNIAKSALAQDVQASLDKADTALQTAPVTSVNRQTGAVLLTASDVGVYLVGISDGSTDINVGSESVNVKNIYLSTDQYGNSVIWLSAEEYAVIPAVDLTPRQNSSHAVTSGGVYDALALKAPLASPAFTGTPTAPTPASGDNSTKVATTAFVQDAVGGITPEPDNTKLNSTSAAPAFDATATYDVGNYVTYNGTLYRCTTAVTVAGEWNAANWTADTMTDPDAVLDITAQNQLRVVAKDGTLLWAQGYDLASTSSATLACDAANNFTFADGATSQAFALPTAPSGKVGDFILDIDNSANTGAASISMTGLDSTFSLVVPKGENLTDMFSFAAGEMAELYFTQTTFTVNNLPTWKVVKQVVENGGATV